MSVLIVVRVAKLATIIERSCAFFGGVFETEEFSHGLDPEPTIPYRDLM
jgi:hypothetical protein